MTIETSEAIKGIAGRKDFYMDTSILALKVIVFLAELAILVIEIVSRNN